MQTGVAPQSGFAETSSTFAATANSQPGMPYQQYQQPAQQIPQTQQPQPQQQQFSGFNQNQYPAQNKPPGTTGNYDLSDQDLQAFFSPKDITASLAEDLLKQFGSGSEGEESMDTSGYYLSSKFVFVSFVSFWSKMLMFNCFFRWCTDIKLRPLLSYKFVR